jgi:DNA invertase Pin-like site-specific DNA recombinase
MARISRKEKNVQAVASEAICNTAIYTRLSVFDSGKADSESILNQQELLESYVSNQPELLLKDVFVDNGESGVDFHRLAWDSLMHECRAGKINCIVLKDLSRLGRNYIETGDYLERVFPALGVRLIAVTDGYDSNNLTNSGRMITSLKNLVNDIYAKDISRKVSTAVYMKQKQGDFIGAYASYGYVKDLRDKNKIVINPETASIVQKIFEWKATGVGTAEICRRLEFQEIPAPSKYNYMKGVLKNQKFKNSLWIQSTITQIIRNPLYLGHMTQGKFKESLCEGKPRRETKREEWVIVENTHEPIVTQELFDRANAVMDKRKMQYDENNGKFVDIGISDNVLKGLVFCADCGKSLMRRKRVGRDGKNVVWFYDCRTHSQHKLCSKKFIHQDELTNAVFEAIRVQLQVCVDADNIVEKLKQENAYTHLHSEIEETENELRRITSLRQALYEDFTAKLLTASEYQFAVEKYNADADKQRQRLESAKSSECIYKRENKWLVAFTRFIDAKKLTVEMTQTLIERVEVGECKRISIIFKFRDELESHMGAVT